MFFDLFLLAGVPFKSNFLMDIIVPSVVMVVVLVWIGNSILNKFGYTLW